VPVNPSAGINEKPARIAPAAAPSVLAAYSAPASCAAVDAMRTIHLEAIGKVAPMHAAGTHSRSTLITSRSSAKDPPPAPSAYDAASSGRTAMSANGISSARIAMAISRPA
jgi:hypothetical protein